MNKGQITKATAADYGRRGAAALAAVRAGNSAGFGPSILGVLRRLRAIEKRMDSAGDGREWAYLSSAWDRLFRAWCVLSGTPSPGQLRPVAGSKLPRRRVFELDAEIESQKTLPEGNRNAGSFPSSENTSNPAGSA